MSTVLGFGAGYIGEIQSYYVAPVDDAGALISGILEAEVTLQLLTPDDAVKLKADGLTWTATAITGLYRVDVPAALVTKAGDWPLVITDGSARFAVQRVVRTVVGIRPETIVQTLEASDQSLAVWDSETLDRTFAQVDDTGYTTASVWMAKRSLSALDSAADIAIWTGTGLATLSGAAPVSPVVAGDGILTSPTTTTGRIQLAARAMDGLGGNGSRSFFWERIGFNASGDKKLLASGKLTIYAGVVINLSGSPT